ncbi:MAG: bifunctional folylpolyglutamate synthase/dihydrofolate synthase [Lachnospiraceae bacterium]|nr:bifunctional folylpolyglutamate synthase/dihydrofolate synthase [Lachnospiraceae bacterium]
MTYEEAVSYIESIPKFTRKNELNNTRELMKRLSNPQERFESIHVAGTNGKGSVCAMLSRALKDAGVKTGRFTSPHLCELTERIAVDEEMITQERFLDAFRKVLAVVERMQSEGFPHPAYFEFLFAMGMTVFAEEKVSYAVIETGLGGRLDATNILEDPALVIITSIGMDHMKYLGNDIVSIAREKAGIIKEGCGVVFDGTNETARQVILSRCREVGAPFYEIGEQTVKLARIRGNAVDFSCKSLYDDTVTITLPFPAVYQARNGAVAFRAAELLLPLGVRSRDRILESFSNTRWPGRMQEIEEGIFLDGAHNADGLEAFVRTVQEMAPEQPVLLFSQLADKDLFSSVRMLSVIPWKKLILTEIPGGRIHPLAEMQRAFEEQGMPRDRIVIEKKVETAYGLLRDSKEADSAAFCAGSLYLIGTLLKMKKENHKEGNR